jgi:hypothetical protein
MGRLQSVALAQARRMTAALWQPTISARRE